MRLSRLDLPRYGKFTDHSIDFGATRPGLPDLHIVYGLNEAGKSTTFAAYLDLLYGIGERSTYNFLHPYNTMKVGARLEFDGSAHELARLKQRSGSLVDDRGQPIAEALLAGALGGIGRDAYRTMFSLDDQSLKEGGNAIVQSKGELGQLLFSASSGLAGLSRSLVAASEEAGAIYKKRSSNTKLTELKRTLETLKNERAAIDTLASAYAALKNSHDQAQSTYDRTTRTLAETKSRHQELTRLLGALPGARELARLSDETEQMRDLPRPPAEWFSLLPQLIRDETRFQALLETADAAIARLTAELEALVVDDRLLSIGSRIELLEQGRIRHLAAEGDLPKRKLALAEQDGVLGRLLAELEQQGHLAPEDLLLPASLTGIIRDLIERRSGVDAEIAAARRELMRSRDHLDSLRQEAAKIGDAAFDATTLNRIESALVVLTGSDTKTQLALEERALSQLRQSAEIQFAQLAPWTGDAAALRLAPAGDTRHIETSRGQANTIDRRISDHEARLRDLITDHAGTVSRISAFVASGPIGDVEALAARRERDFAWQAHLATLDMETARQFENRMRHDDAVSAGRLSHAQELAELRQLRQTETVTTAAIARQRELLAEARSDHDALAVRVSAMMPEAFSGGVAALDRIVALESWSTKRATALEMSEQLTKAKSTVETLRQDLEKQCASLVARLTEAGIGGVDNLPLDDLLRTTREVLAENKAASDARLVHEKNLLDLSRDLAERERDEREAQSAADTWDRQWSEALSGTWFCDKAGSIAAIRAILATLSALPAALKERQDLSQRIVAMERDQERFRSEIAELAGMVGQDPAIGDVLGFAETIADRYHASRHTAELRYDKQAELERQMESRQNLADEFAVHKARKEELTGFFGCDTLAALEHLFGQAKERDRLEERITTLKVQIVETLRATSFEAAQQRLSETDIEEVEREAIELASRIDDLTEQAKLLYSDMSLALQKLEAVGGDDAVARMEAKRRTVLLEIEDLAVRHLTLRTGALAAEQALHIYRDQHRSSMMKRASQAFRLMTGGNYSGLTTQPDKDKEILIGVPREGGSKLADDMSTGTQYQLYLALRLAGYEEFAALRPPVPFIADDIMESFDNPRSEEVFRLLGDMAKVGQVIYLTHHWHLCEIAQRVVPSVVIHHLP
ncbi:uncharacterized protein YhaN [Rhizobium sp. BK226]|uniref:ATP-binding protein n=1 Tax=Rhizobium sp. BK226 TaxID=2587075 RepID=UPI0016182A79|nr:AAA family ATPase [Rhizobium sp. BK226]MBB4112743.1 uncharacterized protein YhaN [Rhizobium sp. BK226]